MPDSLSVGLPRRWQFSLLGSATMLENPGGAVVGECLISWGSLLCETQVASKCH